MATFSDLGAWTLDKLKNTASVTALVMNDATGVIESGQLQSSVVDAAEKLRRDDEATYGTRVLHILVQDRGEFTFEGDIYVRCSVFVLDRSKGYTNIRPTRIEILSNLIPRSVTLTRQGATVIQLRSPGRSGHDIFTNYDLEFEQIDLQGKIVVERDLY